METTLEKEAVKGISYIFILKSLRKLWMGLTGIFLCLFLVVHLLGNLMLVLPQEIAKLKFNAYAHTMTTNPIVIFLSYLTYLSFLIHIIVGIGLSIYNRSKGHFYKGGHKWKENTTIGAKIIDILGLIIFIFLIFHLSDFWYEFKFKDLPLDENGNKDLYSLCVKEFKELSHVIFYVFSMIVVGFHLNHGFLSQFISIGVYHKGFLNFIEKIKIIFAWVISAGFAIIPLWIYVREVILK